MNSKQVFMEQPNSDLSQQRKMNPKQDSLRLIRIYIANFISCQFGINEFTKDAISMIAIYVYQFVVDLVFSMKSKLQMQRRTIPNFLILLYCLKSQGYYLDQFVNYLNRKCQKEKMKRSQTIVSKYHTAEILSRIILIEENEVQQKNYSNIKYVPSFCTHTQDALADPLPVRQFICNQIQKPPEFYYINQLTNIDKNYKNTEQVIRQSIFNEYQMKIAMSNLTKQRKIIENSKADTHYQDEQLYFKPLNHQTINHVPRSRNENKFNLISFL